MRTLATILVSFWVFLAPLKIVAQNDKIEALRMSFISKRLDLSVYEAERFWPIYNEYNDKVKAVKRNLRQSYKRKTEPLSEADAEELYQVELQSRQTELDLYKFYSEKLKAVIGLKKLARLRVAEEDFKREIINTIKEKSD